MTVPGDRRGGYSLAEVLVASALAGVVLVAAMDGLSVSTRSWIAAGAGSDAQTLAHDLLAEVLAQPYTDPDTTDDPDLEDFGPEADETAGDRSTFDDADDYDDWVESPPADRDGAALAGFAGWTRAVVVQKLKKQEVDTYRDDDQDDHGSRRITVVVTGPAGESHTVAAIRARRGAMERPLGVTTDFVTGLSIDVRAGGADTVRSSTRLVNHAEAP